jgi:hypothetical protein
MTPPKTDQFVPLLTAMPSGERRESQITIISQEAQPQTFQTLEKGLPKAMERTPSKNHGEPSLSVERDDGRIKSIHVKCSCGQTINVECVYPETPKVEGSGTSQ